MMFIYYWRVFREIMVDMKLYIALNNTILVLRQSKVATV